MALCLPRSRRAASLATRPSTLSVASITNHSCFTSAGLALTVVVIKTLEFGLADPFPRSVSLWRGPLRWHADRCAPGALRHCRCPPVLSVAGPKWRYGTQHYTKADEGCPPPPRPGGDA